VNKHETCGKKLTEQRINRKNQLRNLEKSIDNRGIGRTGRVKLKVIGSRTVIKGRK
jgi:hypothetical protein